MQFFVITEKGEADFNPPVFYAGPNDEEEAIGVFTTREAAEAYLQAAGWTATDEIAELESLDLLRWMLEAEAEGAHYLVVDPGYEVEDGTEYPVLVLAEELRQLAEVMTNDVLSLRE